MKSTFAFLNYYLYLSQRCEGVRVYIVESQYYYLYLLLHINSLIISLLSVDWFFITIEVEWFILSLEREWNRLLALYLLPKGSNNPEKFLWVIQKYDYERKGISIIYEESQPPKTL